MKLFAKTKKSVLRVYALLALLQLSLVSWAQSQSVIFSLTITATDNVSVAAGEDQSLANYATITGGSALVHNGHSSKEANMIGKKGVRVGNSSGSYLKITLDEPLQEGDIITTTGDDGGFVAISNVSSDDDNIKGNTMTLISDFANASTLYIKRGATMPWMATIKITRPSAAPSVLTLTDGEDYTRSADATYDEVTFTKEFSASLANKWTAIYVPFSIDVEAHSTLFDIAEIYAFCPYRDTNGDGTVDTDDDDMLVLFKKQAGQTLPNVPYLIRSKKAGTVTIKAADGKVYAAADGTINCYTTKAEYTITGLNTAVTATPENDYYYTSGGTISHRLTGSTVIKPNRWYMTVRANDAYAADDVAEAKPSIGIFVIGEDDAEATAAVTVKADAPATDGAVYNLSGFRVTGTLRPGMYIRNNKKFIVK